MTTTIDYPVHYHPDNKSENFEDVKSEYFCILQACTTSDDSTRLKEQIRILSPTTYFKIGFGSSHMWVKQIGGIGILHDRCVLVEF